MQNTALKRFKTPLPETSKQPHFTLYATRDDSDQTVARASEISPLLKKEKSCCDKATD